MACRRRSGPVVIRGDSQLPARRRAALRLAKELVYPRLLGLFDGFLYVGRRNRDYLRHYGLAERRLFFSPHCVDNDSFAARAEAERAARRDRGGRAPALKSVLFAGKLVERKRPFDVIRALALAANQGCRAQAAFVGAGES